MYLVGCDINLFLITFVPYLQRNIDIAAPAFDVVGIQDFCILPFQNTAFATHFTVVQAFPGIDYICLPFFTGRSFSLFLLLLFSPACV